MRLRTFESYGLIKNGIMNSYPMLEKDITADVVVIGAGITGALVSDALFAAGYKTVVIDKRDVAMGSTAATTSMLQYEIDVQLHKLAELIGESNAAACYQAGISALNELEQLIKQYKIDCGYEPKKSLYYAHSAKAAKELHKEWEMREKHNLDVQWLSENNIRDTYGINSYGGILSAHAASIDAYRLAHALLKRNTQKGMQVFDQTAIEKFDCKKNGVTVTTSTGNIVKAKKIVFCTGFESTRLVKEKIADLFYTYAIISEQNIQLPAALHNTLIWNTENPYLYMRTTTDGRLLAGGKDDDKLDQKNVEKKKKIKEVQLLQKLEKTITGIHFINDFTWGGIFGSTKDGLPYIGSTPEYKNAFFVLGFGGNGITFSVQARKIIIDLIENRPNKLAVNYRFGR